MINGTRAKFRWIYARVVHRARRRRTRGEKRIAKSEHGDGNGEEGGEENKKTV